jgi:putative SOS response-associated peptidase YedK
VLGLIPYWCEDPKGGRKPINAKCETVRTLPSFREAYRKRRCILPVDGFFEWKAIKGQKAKQPYAIAVKGGSPFGIGGLWENWRDPTSGEWVRTFAIITTGQRAGRRDSRPHASDPRAYRLRPVAERRA